MGIKSYQDSHDWFKIVIIGLRMVSSFLTMAKKVAKRGQMDIKMIVIRMVRMGKEWSIRGCQSSEVSRWSLESMKWF